MPKKTHDAARTASPRRLRRRLEKLDIRLAKATEKRDRAQARVDALAIIVDEARAALAAAEPAALLSVAPPDGAAERPRPTTAGAGRSGTSSARASRRSAASASSPARRGRPDGAGPSATT